MTDAQKFLCRNIFVSNDTYNRRHKDGDYTLHGIEQTDLFSKADRNQIAAHGCEIGSPHCPLKEIHQDQPEFYCFIHIESLMFVNIHDSICGRRSNIHRN